MEKVYTNIMFPFVVQKVLFNFLRKLPLDNQTSIIINSQNSEIFTPFSRNYFNSRLIQNIIYFVYTHLHFISIYNFSILRPDSIFFERTLMFLPENIWIKLRHLLHSLTACSYLCFSIYFSIGLSWKVLYISFNSYTESSFNCPMQSLFFLTYTSIINEWFISSEYSTLTDKSEAVVSLVN